MNATDLSDAAQAFVRMILVMAALLKFYRSGYANGRRHDDVRKTQFLWRNCDAVVLVFALLQGYGVFYLLVRILDAPLTTMDVMRALILPTTIVSNILLTVHFLNGQVNTFIRQVIDAGRLRCKLTRN